MKRILPILILLGIAAGALASPYLMVLARKNAGGAAPSYDFVETFEGSEVDSQSTAGYDNTGWTANNASIDPNYSTSPAPLVGAASLYHGFSLRYIGRSVAASDELWVYWRMYGTVEGTIESQAMDLLDGSGATMGRVSVRSNLLECYLRHGTVWSSANIDNWDDGAEYHVWVHWVKGTGTDGQAELYVSSTATRPGSPDRSITTGTGTNSVEEIRFYGTTSLMIYDSVIHNASEIGNNPL